jgi:hypothetical protein
VTTELEIVQTPTQTDCKNCGSPVTERFCGVCGQRAEVERLTLPRLIHELPHTLFHVDRGFVPTLKSLFSAPSEAINGYLDGHRIRYSNPLTLLVILAGLCAAAYSAYPFQFVPRSQTISVSDAEHFQRFTALSFKFYSFTLIAYIPGLALITWLSFWRNERSYGEHIVINAFVIAATSATMLFMFPFMVLADSSGQLMQMMSVYVILSLMYQLYAWHRVFALPNKWLSTALRSAVAMVLYLALFQLLTFLVFRFIYLPVVSGA